MGVRVSAMMARSLAVAVLLLPLTAIAACDRQGPADRSDAKLSPSAGSTETPNIGALDEVVSSIAGIHVGSTVDADVVAMYGPGVAYGYQDQPVDRRYYTDPSHGVTLMSGWHTDGVVLALVLTQGTALPPGVDPALTVTSLSVPVEVDKGILLGMTPEEVVGRLGRPQHESNREGGNEQTLSYDVRAEDPAEAGWISCSTVLDFEYGRLCRIAVYGGD